jgi:PEP-CTERM motif
MSFALPWIINTSKSILNKSLVWGGLLGIAATSVVSAPIYYAFTGSTLTTQAIAGFASPYAPGQKVKFVIAVDRDRLGEWVDEKTGLAESIPGDAPGESFFAAWVGGNLAQTEPLVEDPASYFLGLQWGNQGQLLTSNGNKTGFDMLQIMHLGLNINDWVVGATGFKAEHWMYSNSSFGPVAGFDLTLTRIQPALPGEDLAAIPEPGSLALLGIGLVFVAYRTRKPLRQLGKRSDRV